MSLEHTEMFRCPQCGKESPYTIWDSLNADLDPDAKQQLLDGTLFEFECTHCKSKADVAYDILYNDMTHQVMVQLTQKDRVEEAKASMESVMGMVAPIPGLRYRIVTDPNELQEKAQIFDLGLDDRLVEIIKFFMYANARERMAEAQIESVYFNLHNGGYWLAFCGAESFTMPLSEELYEAFQQEFAEKIESAGESAVVDLSWVIGLLEQDTDDNS